MLLLKLVAVSQNFFRFQGNFLFLMDWYLSGTLRSRGKGHTEKQHKGDRDKQWFLSLSYHLFPHCDNQVFD